MTILAEPLTAPAPPLQGAALAWATLDQITAHPELWDQSSWFSKAECGTAGCFAGWACLLTGHEPVVAEPCDIPDCDFCEPRLGLTGDVYVRGERVPAEIVAADRLRITPAQAAELFCGHNTLEVLQRHVTEFFGPRPA